MAQSGFQGNDPDKLTKREQRFVDLFLVSQNAADAYAKAFNTVGGSSSPTARANGSRLLRKPRVKAAVDAAMQQRAQRTAVDQDYVINTAREVVERCLDRVPVAPRKGDPKGVHRWTFNAAGAASALALLAKHTGLGERPNVNINIPFEQLTDAQLEHLANGGSLASLPR